MTGAALLDVNVLVALFDPDHVHHDAAHTWFGVHRGRGWATCPLTENGVVRVLSNAAYSGVHETVANVRQRLDAFCASGDHVFWSDSVSVRDEGVFDLAAVTPRQLTDVYLLALAVARKGRLATFDRHITLRAVPSATPDDLEVIPA